MADGKDSWTDLGIKHSNTNDPYKPDNLTEVHNVDLNKMSSSSHKTPKRNVNIQCPECLKFFPADRAGFMSEPNQCDHYSHKDSYFIGSNKWRELVGLELNEFCPKCGRKLSW
jgi:ribosomal protein L33